MKRHGRFDDHRTHEYRMRPRPLDLADELTRRAAELVPEDPIRKLLGDPPVGRSALDKLRAKQNK